LPDLVHAEAICIGVALGSFKAEAFNEMTIYEGMLSRDLGGRSTCDLAANTTRFQ
jgi:hypothetical protein